MEIFLTILLLMAIVALSDIIYRFSPIKVPLPLLQIALGALVAMPSFGLHVEFDPELFLLLFIPPLLFSDGRRMPFQEFMESKAEILSLALFLVFITILGLGFIIPQILPEMPMAVAFALAAVLSPTDAVALSGIVGKGRLPKHMNKILEGEALLNDASGLVSLKYAVGIIMGTLVFNSFEDYVELGGGFLVVAGGGILVGILITFVYVRCIRFFIQEKGDDAATQMIFFIILPFLVYGIAEHIGTSGILAAVSAGMTVNYSNAMKHTTINVRLQANSVWSILEFILNGVVFLMLGLQIPEIIEFSVDKIQNDVNTTMTTLMIDVFVVYGLLMLVRFIWLLCMREIKLFLAKKNNRKTECFTMKELVIMTFAGVRGAVTLAGALSIPNFISTSPTFIAVPARYQVTFIAICVILLSLIVAVVILPLLLRGVVVSDKKELEAEKNIAYASMLEASLASLQTLEERIVQTSEVHVDPQKVKEIHTNLVLKLKNVLGVKDVEGAFYDSIELRFRLTALRAQRGELKRLEKGKKISEEVANELGYEIDLLENALIGGRGAKEKNHE